MIKVMVVDDHAIVRLGIVATLSKERDIQMLDGGKSGEEAIVAASRHHPHVVLMDLQMPGMGGIEATKRILRVSPGSKVLILTVLASSPLPEAALEAGAAGYVTKKSSVDNLLCAIRSVHSRTRYISEDVAHQLAMKSFNKHMMAPFSTLSGREMQIATMLIHCQKVSAIAKHLSLSPKTVNSYRYRIFDKLGISSDLELAILAIRHNIVDVHTLPAKLDSGDRAGSD